MILIKQENLDNLSWTSREFFFLLFIAAKFNARIYSYELILYIDGWREIPIRPCFMRTVDEEKQIKFLW